MIESVQRYYARGKLLISGEYLVLEGAQALAVPAQWGQEMLVTKINVPYVIHWKTNQQTKPWFSGEYDLKEHAWKNQSNLATASYLKQVLQAIDVLNPDLFEHGGYEINCNLEFPFDWGLGSSATLISNLAEWSEIDPYDLNDKISRGSGYDIAAARSQHPILYRLTQLGRAIEEVNFNPPFADHLLFVHLGKKQDTEKSVASFIGNDQTPRTQIDAISDISNSLSHEYSLNGFMDSLVQHEKIVSEVLGLETVQARMFSDFDGVVKSLGAWGGDFVLAASEMPMQSMREYFLKNGFETIVPYHEMVLNE